MVEYGIQHIFFSVFYHTFITVGNGGSDQIIWQYYLIVGSLQKQRKALQEAVPYNYFIIWMMTLGASSSKPSSRPPLRDYGPHTKVFLKIGIVKIHIVAIK